jgi:hypothetical protein
MEANANKRMQAMARIRIHQSLSFLWYLSAQVYVECFQVNRSVLALKAARMVG